MNPADSDNPMPRAEPTSQPPSIQSSALTANPIPRERRMRRWPGDSIPAPEVVSAILNPSVKLKELDPLLRRAAERYRHDDFMNGQRHSSANPIPGPGTFMCPFGCDVPYLDTVSEKKHVRHHLLPSSGLCLRCCEGRNFGRVNHFCAYHTDKLEWLPPAISKVYYDGERKLEVPAEQEQNDHAEAHDALSGNALESSRIDETELGETVWRSGDGDRAFAERWRRLVQRLKGGI